MTARFTPSPQQRVEYHAARLLAGLPAGARVRLSGRPRVSIDGNTLDSGFQLVLALAERRGEPAPETVPVSQARILRRDAASLYGARGVEVGAVEELQLDTQPSLRARHYAPPKEPASAGDEDPRPPLLVYYHGGGFTYGDLDSHDSVCRLLCRHTQAHVLAVDYRLAPEHPFPAAVQDARAAFGWACENAGRLGADARLLGVGGDSAGGNLAAVVSQMALRDGGRPPALQLLIYPALDFTTRRRSRDSFAEAFLLTESEMRWFEDNYLGAERRHADDPRASPLLAADLAGLPPAIVITAGFDPLRDEGEEYAQALRRAGVPVAQRRFPGFIHGFVNLTGLLRASREAVVEIAGITHGMFRAVRGAAAG